MKCSQCGETMVGDGYSSVMYCPNGREEKSEQIESSEPDANPIECDFENENGA